MSEKFLTVIAGRKTPAKVLIGTLNKQSGQPQGTPQKMELVTGELHLPNYSKVWAKRMPLDKNKMKDKQRLQINDSNYGGVLEFLQWGDTDGELVEIRYLPTSHSLDKQYQEQVQKLTAKEADNFLKFIPGLNYFNPKTTPALCTMVKVHTLCLDSVSRNPDITDYDWTIYDSEKRNKNRLKEVNTRHTAEAYAIQANKDSNIATILAHVFNIDPMLPPDVIVEKLLEKSSDFPEQFVKSITDFQHKAQIDFSDAIDNGVLDVDAGTSININFRDGKKDILLSGAEGKDRNKGIWFMTQVIKDMNVFNAYQKFGAELQAVRREKA